MNAAVTNVTMNTAKATSDLVHKSMNSARFLPVSIEDMRERGWDSYDFLCITGDAYVDHPSFGIAIISRLIESLGFRVAILACPDWRNTESFRALGRPAVAAFVTSGNIDSMVSNYTVAKKRRKEDDYAPGGKGGGRPDRALTVYCKKIREAYPGLPVVCGGLEASLRRFAHYDYWADQVMPSVLADSGADLLVYGMGERPTTDICRRLAVGEPISKLTDIRGTGFMADKAPDGPFSYIECTPYEKAANDHTEYAKACRLQYREHDFTSQNAIIQRHRSRFVIVNPPARPLTTEEFDRVYELPYVRDYHPSYEKDGGVPGIEEVRFSIIHNRGCFGGCNFCSLAFHQGRFVSVRSHESVIQEATLLTKLPGFKGYIHDVGGPTANFRTPSCEKQKEHGLCSDRACLAPIPCKNLTVDHSDYLALLRKLRELPGVKKVFVRSGIRFDYLLYDPDETFFNELVKYHISGQLKVAPEHCSDNVLALMGKPAFSVYQKFAEKYKKLNEKYGLKQYLVPYLISSHPGATLQDAVCVAEYLNSINYCPEQVQDFYPTPGTISTCMYYTGLDPRTMKPVYIPNSPHEKAMQRALLQWRKPVNRELVLEALHKARREDLIGFKKNCLVAGPPVQNHKPSNMRQAKKTKPTAAH